MPILAEPVAGEGGPVLVTVEYEIDPADAAGLRRRDRRCSATSAGATAPSSGSVFTDAENPRRRVEAFMLESWLDHLRQHERVTVEDRRLQERVRALHRGAARPASPT